jgi:hypothetical protein
VKALIAIAVVVLLIGCAAAPEYTREEWLAGTERSYEGVTAKQVLGAAEQVFRLADPDDVTFEYGPDFLIARRDWWHATTFPPLVSIVTETWEVTARDTERGGTRASVRFTSEHNIAPPRQRLSRPEAYALLWDRIDYLLGRRSDWPVCRDVPHPATYDGLCGQYVEDLKPPGARVVPWKPPRA